MNYLKFGDSKKFLVFLHGWSADLNSFLFTKDYFADYTKVFVDFAGFGKSPEPERPYFVSDYVKELKDLLQSFEIDELVLVGHSFGGRVAIKYSLLYQKDYKSFRVCLVDSAGLRPKLSLVRKFKVWRYKRLKKKAQNDEKLKARLSKFGSDDYKNLSMIMRQTFVNVVNEDLTPFAQGIDSDCVIVWGDRDKETKLWMARKLNRLIKNSNLAIIKNAGHFSFIDNMQEFLIILDTFLKN